MPRDTRHGARWDAGAAQALHRVLLLRQVTVLISSTLTTRRIGPPSPVCRVHPQFFRKSFSLGDGAATGLGRAARNGHHRVHRRWRAVQRFSRRVRWFPHAIRPATEPAHTRATCGRRGVFAFMTNGRRSNEKKMLVAQTGLTTRVVDGSAVQSSGGDCCDLVNRSPSAWRVTKMKMP